jgi:NADH-quinone oxidoreductase subunit F
METRMNVDVDNSLELKENPPCKMACPILTDVRDYVQCIAERRFKAAFVSIRRQNPLPRTCGRICTHPCETACKRGQIDEPIAIAALKRFAADGPWKEHYQESIPPKTSRHKVAVIGSGPAGLAAAHDLALLGHKVTIFEALPMPGGMLRVGVPEYRLPKDVLDQEIEAIVDLGVEIETATRIGMDINFNDLFKQGFVAVFVAIGAHEDRKLGIAGEDLRGVVSAVFYLRAVNQGQNPEVGKRVAVIGGGNTAIDSARSLVRMGVEDVHIVYRRTKDQMPAALEEIDEAIQEGVQMAYLTSPIEVLGKDGKVVSLKCSKNVLGDSDASGRRSPKPVSGSEFTMDVDTVVAAIGQAPDMTCFARDFDLGQKGQLIHLESPDTLATGRAGVFAGGDAVTGPATAIQAIAAGKKAALSIDAFLNGNSASSITAAAAETVSEVSPIVVEKTKTFPRCEPGNLPVADRIAHFKEVKSPLSDDAAVEEAMRCLHCHLGARVDQEKCISCLNCVQACPIGAPSAAKMGEIHIDPVACQACGVCVLECPVQAIDIALQPREDIIDGIKKALSVSQDSVVIGFFDYCGKFGRNDVDRLKEDYPSLVPIMVHGLRRIDGAHVLKAFELGADAVLLAGCPPDYDAFPGTRDNIKGRMADARAILDILGINGNRLKLIDMPEKGLIEGEQIEEVVSTIGELGPNPLRQVAGSRVVQ